MDNGVAQVEKERPPPQGECSPCLEFGTVNDVNVTDQLPPGVEDNHIHLTDDNVVFAPKFERPAQGEIERPPPQGEQHPRPGCDTINDTIVTDQTQLEVQQISAAAGKGKGNDYSTAPFLGSPSLSLPLTWPQQHDHQLYCSMAGFTLLRWVRTLPDMSLLLCRPSLP